jgi:hypothetical protein
MCWWKSLGVYDDRSVLDVRKVKSEGEISGGKCDQEVLVVRTCG